MAEDRCMHTCVRPLAHAYVHVALSISPRRSLHMPCTRLHACRSIFRDNAFDPPLQYSCCGDSKDCPACVCARVRACTCMPACVAGIHVRVGRACVWHVCVFVRVLACVCVRLRACVHMRVCPCPCERAYIVIVHVVTAYIGMAYTGMAHIGMAFIIMAYVVMAYIVMAHIGMAYIGMAHIGMAYMGMAHIGMAYIGMAYIVMDYILMAYIVMACIVMACSGNSTSCIGCACAPLFRSLSKGKP